MLLGIEGVASSTRMSYETLSTCSITPCPLWHIGGREPCLPKCLVSIKEVEADRSLHLLGT
jgi:hypothetical protein